MVGATVAGGVTHGMAILSHAEREAAKNALAKLKSLGSGLGSHLSGSTESATVYGGASVKSGGLGSASMVRGHGSDTFMGGSGNATTHALANIGNDTVVSGSATGRGPDHMGTPNVQHFALNSDTIDIKGTTAEGLKAHPEQEAKAGAHTVTLQDKTTVTVSGLSQHDVGKLTH